MDYQDNKYKYREFLLKSILDRLNRLENKDDNFQTILNKFNLNINNRIDTRIKDVDDKITKLFTQLNKKQSLQYHQTNKRISLLEHKLDYSVEKLKHIPTISDKELLSLYNQIKDKVDKNIDINN